MRSWGPSGARSRRRDKKPLARLRPSRRALAFAVSAAFSAGATNSLANPSGGSVVAGGVTFSVNGGVLTITNTPGSIINWQQFSIQRDEITRFIQQSAASTVLNRVVGLNPSVILGQLTSNGRVFLINPSGITFGQGSVIDVAGFAASSLNISDADFISGRMRFTGTGGEGKVTNAGTIRTTEGGHVYLIAPNVENQKGAVITSPKGEVIIAAGQTVELVNSRTPDIRVEFTAPQGEAVNAGDVVAASGSIGVYGNLVRNSGRVSASRAEVGDGGKIVFKATKDVTIEAGSVIEASGGSGGSVTVQAESGIALVSGTIDATGVEAKGGDAKILGHAVGLVDNALVDASGELGGGTILVGGDFQGANANVQNAQKTYVGPSAVLRADARKKGDGGKVVVWSNDWTQFFGRLSARGGLLGGNGGFAEVSGAITLDYLGRADLRAPNGRMGDLLLDPKDITIVAGADQVLALDDILRTLGTPTEFLSQELTATPSVIHDGTINAQLDTANVRVKTGGGSTGSGTITFDTTAGAIALGPATFSGARNLTFDANGSIVFSGGNGTTVDLNGGELTLRANAGGISQIGSSPLAMTDSSELLMIAATGIGASGTPFITTGVTGLAATTTAAGGGIFIQNSGSNVLLRSLLTGNDLTGAGVDSASGLSTRGGDIRLQNSGSISSQSAAAIKTTAALNSGDASGKITLSAGTGVNLAGALDSDGAANSSGNGSAGGDITVTTTNGSIALADIDARGGSAIGGSGGAGGNLIITAAGSTATVTLNNGSVRTDGGNSSSTAGVGGSVTVSGQAGVSILDPILTEGGAVTITSSAGAVTSNASGDITTTAIANTGFASGAVTISGATGVTLAGKIDTEGANNNTATASAGGAVQVTSGGPISLAVIDARGGNSTGGNGNGGQGGSITITATGGSSDATLNGSLKTDSGTPDGTGTQLAGGAVTIAGEAGVLVKALINTEGGAVNISSSAGGVTSLTGDDITTKALANRDIASGSVTIHAATDVNLAGTIDTDGAANNAGNGSAGGAVQITADSGVVNLAAVDTRGGNATGGNGGAGGTLTISAGGTVTIGGVVTTAAGTGGTPGADGTVQIKGSDVNIPGSINSGSADVTFLTATQGAIIGVGDAGKTFNLTDIDLDDVNTTGTIRIGSVATNTGGISIGAAEALTQGSNKFAFATAGGIAVGANNFTTAGTVSLTSSAGAISTGTGVVAASTLTANASTGIALNTNVATLSLTNAGSGAVAVNDVDAVSVSGSNSGGGAFNITVNAADGLLTVNGGGITSNGGAVTLTSDNMTISSTISSGAGLVTLKPSTNSAAIQVGLGATDGAGVLGIDDIELTKITGTGGLTIGSLAQTGNITIVGAASASGLTGGVFSLLTTGTGSITVDDALSVGSGVGISLAGAGGVTNNDTITGPGGVTIDAGTSLFTNSATGTVTNGGTAGSISIVADDVELVTGSSIAGGSGAVQIAPKTASRSIDVGTETGGKLSLTDPELDTITTSGMVTIGGTGTGSLDVTALISIPGTNLRLKADNVAIGATINAGAGIVQIAPSTAGRAIDLGTETVGSMSLTDAEIDRITAGTIRVGDATSGAISVTNAITPLGTTTLSLISGAGITSSPGGSIAVTNLALTAAGNVDLTANPNTVSNLAASITGSGHSLAFDNSGALSVENVDNIAGITTSTGDVSLHADTGGITLNQDINAIGAKVTLQADSFTLTPGTIHAGEIDLILNGGADIRLGTGGDLTDAQIDLLGIGSGGNVHIGNAGSGDIIFLSPITGAYEAGALGDIAYNLLSLTTGGAVIDSNLTGVTVTVRDLAIHAASGIGTSTDPLKTQVSNLAVSNSTGGGTFIVNKGALKLTPLDGITTISSAGGLTISATSPLTVSLDINQAAPIDLTAGEDPGAIAGDNLTVDPNITIRSAGGDVNLRAGDNVVIGAGALVRSDTGTVSLTARYNDNDNIGSVQFAGTTGSVQANTINLDAGAGSIGSLSNPIRVQNDSGLASPSVTATATGAGATIAIEQVAGPLTTNSYTLVTDAASPQSIFLSTTDSSLTFNGFGGGSLGTGGDNISLTAGGANDLSISSSLTTTGNVSLASGADIAPTGAFTITANSLAASAMGDIGSSLAPLLTATATLAATGDNVYVSNAGPLTLATVNSVTNNATGGTYRLTNDNALTIGTGGVSAANVNLQGTTIDGSGTVTGTTEASLKATTGDIGSSGTPLSTATAKLAADGASVYVSNAGPLTLDLVNGVSNTATGVYQLTNDAALTVGADGVTATGAVSLTATALTNSGAISGAGVTLTADNMDLVGGTVAGGSSAVTLQQLTTNQAIDLGGADGAGILGLADTELDTITTTGPLRIGNANTGAITISASIDTANVNTTRLTGSSIGGSATFTENFLALVSTGDIGSTGTALSTATAKLAANGANVHVSNGGALTLDTVDTVDSGATTTYKLTNDNTLTIGAGGVSAANVYLQSTAIDGLGLVTGTTEISLKATAGDIGTTGAALSTATAKLGATGDNVYVSNAGPLTLATVNSVSNSATTIYRLTNDDTLTTGTGGVSGDKTYLQGTAIDGSGLVTGTTELSLKATAGGVGTSSVALSTATAKLGATGDNVYVSNAGPLTLATVNSVSNSATGGTYQLTNDDTLTTGAGGVSAANVYLEGTAIDGSGLVTGTTEISLKATAGDVGTTGTALSTATAKLAAMGDNVYVSNTGSLTLATVNSLTNSATGSYELTADGITVTSTDVGGGALTALTASSGGIGGAGSVAGASVALKASANIGASGTGNALATAAGNLAADAASVYLSNTGALVLDDVVTSLATVTNKAGVSGIYELTNSADVTVTATNVGGGTLTALMASTGGIGGSGSVTGTSVALKATGDIGSSGAGNQLKTTAGTLAADAANVYLSNTGAVVLDDVTTSLATVTNNAGVAGTYELTNSAGITVTAASVGNGALTALTASTGNIGGLGSVAGTSVALSATGDIGSLGAGNQLKTVAGTLAAGGANVYVSNTGAVVLNDVSSSTGTVTNAADSSYELTNSAGITVTGSVGGGTLTALTATGSITGAGSVTGASVALKATGDIGSAGPASQLATTAGTLAADAANVYVSNSGLLTLNDVTTSLETVTNKAGASGSYEVTNDSTITVSGTNVGGGALTALTAQGLGSNIGGAGSVKGASVVLSATGDDIGASGAGNQLKTVAGTLAAGGANVYVSNTGALVLNDVSSSTGTVTNAADSSYELTNSAGITVTGSVSAGSPGAGTIVLDPTGALINGGGTLTADTINLGTGGNATAIGATGAGRILVNGGSTNPTVTAKATTGGIFLQQTSGDLHTASYKLDVGTSAQAIELATTNGHITIDHNYTTQWNANTQDDNVTLIAAGAAPVKNIVGGSTLITSGNVTLNASGGIGVGTAVTLNASGNISLTSAGSGTNGNITVVQTVAGGFNTNKVTTLATDAGTAQAVALTYSPGVAADFTIGGSLGNTQDDLLLSNTNGNIVGGAGTATANVLMLSAALGGVGVGTPVKTEAVVLRASARDDIEIVEATAVQLGNGASGIASSSGNISIATTDGAITTGNSITASAPGGSISLTAGGTNGITLNHAVTAGASTGLVTLDAGAATTQGAGGVITTVRLELLGAGPYTLTNPNNDVAEIAANTSGAISYRDLNDLTVGSAGGTSGITNLGADVTLQTAGGLLIDQPINIGLANLTLNTGDAATQSSTGWITAGGLELLGAGPYALTNSLNNVVTIAGDVTNAVQYTDADALTVDQVNSTIGLKASSVVLETVSSLLADPLTLAQDVNAGLGDVRLLTQSLVDQTGGAITAGTLGVRAQGGVNLAQPGNHADVVAIFNGTGNAVSYTDSAGFIIGTAGDLGNFTSVSGIRNVGQPVTLTAGDAVTQTQPIIAGGLELLGAGPFTLTNPLNNVDTIAGDVTSAVQYTDVDALTVGQVNTIGLKASSVVLETKSSLLADALTLAEDVNAGGGDVRLLTQSLVDQTGGAITAGTLGVRAQGGVTLTQAGNHADIVAIFNGTGNAVSYTDSAGFVIGTAGDLGNFTSASGIRNVGQPVTLTAGDAVTQTQPIIGGSLELLGSGPYTLTNSANNVTTIAASGPTGVDYTDADSLTVGQVNSTIGMTVGGNVQLTTLAGGALTVSNDITTLATGTVTLTNAGVLNLDANINADGAVTQNGAGAVTVGGTGTRTITTTNDNVSFATAVTLNAPLSIDTGAGAGDITFSSTLSGGQDLTLAAGTGNITFTGAVGSPARLGAIQINSASDVTANAITAASLTQAAGSGLTDLNGVVDTNAAGGVALTTNNINVDNTITTSNSGPVTFTNAGTLNLNANISSDGAVTQDGAGAVVIGGVGTRIIQTSKDDVSFASAVTSTVPVSIDTDPGSGTGAGNISFASSLTSSQSVNLEAGALGAIGVTGDLQAASLGITTSATSSFTGQVIVTGGVTLGGGAGDVSFLSGLNTGAASASTFANSGTLQIGDDLADASSIGTSLVHTAGPTILAGTISTPTVQLDATALVADTAINASSTVDFTSTLVGPGGLTVATGGNTTFTGTVGTGTHLAFLTTNGGGTTRINGGSITTDGAQFYDEKVTGNNVTLSSMNDQAITAIDATNDFTGTLSLRGGTVQITDANSITLGSGSMTGRATIIALDGGITTTTSFTANGGVTFRADDQGLTEDAAGPGRGFITIGGALTASSGSILLHAADDITVNGAVTSGGNYVELIAGLSDGLKTASITEYAREATRDNVAAIRFNAPVDAGAGQMVIVTAVQPSVYDATHRSDVTQGANGGLKSSALAVVTLKGSGGAVGGDILLDTVVSPPNTQNTNPNVQFMTCAFDGCPAPLPGNPVAPIIAGSGYSNGVIRYIGAGGVNLTGIGTIGDFYSFTSGPFTLTANPFSAGNVTIESDNDIIIDLDSNLLKTSDDPTKSLNFFAKGNIRYVNKAYGDPTVGGGTIGTPTNPFNNHLNMTAAGSILLENSLYQNTQNLLLAANTGFTSTNQPSPVLPSGTGDVTLQGNYTIQTGGNVTVRGRDFSVLGGDSGGYFQSASGQELIAAGTIDIQNTGVIKVKAGTAVVDSAKDPLDPNTYPSGSGARIEGGTVNVTSASALVIEGGTNTIGVATNDTSNPDIKRKQANAAVVSTGDMNVALGSASASSLGLATPPLAGNYSLVVRGGPDATASRLTPESLFVTANASLEAKNLVLDTQGHLYFQGGTSNLNRLNAVAATNAQLLVDGTKTITTHNGGSVVLIGGKTNVRASDINTGAPITSISAPNSQALARIDPSKLTMTVDGILVVQGGTSTGPAGSLSSARIDAGDEIRITVNGTGTYNYGTGPLGPASFFMIGGPDSGFFDANNVDLAGSLPYPQAFPITVTLAGPFMKVTDPSLTGGIVQTGAITFDDQLLSYVIFAANEETRVFGIRRGAMDTDDVTPACK